MHLWIIAWNWIENINGDALNSDDALWISEKYQSNWSLNIFDQSTFKNF